MIGTNGPDRLEGGAGDDILEGLGGDDVLIGGAGADRTDGGSGSDTHFVDNERDVVVERAGEGDDRVVASVGYALAAGAEVEALFAAEGGQPLHLIGNEFAQSVYGNGGANRLEGRGGADYLAGLGGDDLLDGGSGADNMRGGLGNDSYRIDHEGDALYEDAGEGEDLLVASVSYRLRSGSEVEMLIAAEGSAAIGLSGNEHGQSIYGNLGANVLMGLGGNDYLVGLGGDDTLDGGTGADNMRGGAGNDNYRVDSEHDGVFEAAGEGEDVLLSSVSYNLGAGSQVETLIAAEGSAAIHLAGNDYAQSLHGNAGANVLRGGGGNDYLAGYEGADQLDGGAGADNMRGGTGNDLYRIDDAADAVFEEAGQGDDVVLASLSYRLRSEAEVETLIAQEGASSIDLIGNELAQSLYGNAGANVLRGLGGSDYLAGEAGHDTLDGGEGADNMRGGLGNDSYRIDHVGDAVLEFAGEGDDTVVTSISYALGAGLEIEGLFAAEGTSPIALTGNEFGQSLYGNAANNVLNGHGGADYLVGGPGSDSFAFTVALGAANVDIINDFNVAEDKILLGGEAGQPFAALASGIVGAGAFVTGTAATQPDDMVIYDPATGSLLYDADGSGAGAAVRFATLSSGLSLTAQNFVVSGPENRLPVISSASSASVAENSAASTIVYQATASDPDGDRITFSLAGPDADKLTIDESGAVRLKAPADFETKSSYVFSVVASDSGPNPTSKQVTLTVTDVAESLPRYTISDQEPNDTSGTAQPLDRGRFTPASDPNLPDQSLPSATITGNIATGGDKDFFSIHLKEGELLILDVDGTVTLDAELRVVDPSGTQIALNDDPGSFDPGSSAHAGLSHNMDSFIRVRAPTTGTYTFSIQSFVEESGSTTSGGYTLHVLVGPPASRAQINEENIQAMLSGSAWQSLTVTYGFPTSGSQYGGDGSKEIAAGFQALTAAQQGVVRTVLAEVAEYTNLSFSEVTSNPGSAQMRYGLSSEPETAHAYEPGPGNGGDSWYNKLEYLNPVRGNYEWLTFAHESGHALGLKHGHESPALSPDRDSLEFSAMTYRSYVGDSLEGGGGYSNESFGYPQTLMMYDIAALQRMYGADFTLNAGDTVYSWASSNGAFIVNGAAQWAPGANRIFMTLWDGGGIDTYDLSNYSAGASIDLRPGEWSLFSLVQRAHLGHGNYARGNVANALQYNNDPRSLIENAIGTGGADTIIGNDAANRLIGGPGSDTFRFLTLSQSPSEAPDTLADFLHGADKIDLSQIDAIASTGADEAFTFIGTNAFSGTAGELRLSVSGGVTNVFADVNGDTVADLHIIVSATNLDQTDFLF